MGTNARGVDCSSLPFRRRRPSDCLSGTNICHIIANYPKHEQILAEGKNFVSPPDSWDFLYPLSLCCTLISLSQVYAKDLAMLLLSVAANWECMRMEHENQPAPPAVTANLTVCLSVISAFCCKRSRIHVA